MITVSTESIDSYGRMTRRKFKTLAGARKYAVDRVGEGPDIGGSYAVACDGVVTLYVDGCSLEELFGVRPLRPDPREADWRRANEMEADFEAADAAAEASSATYKPFRMPACTCSDQQLALVGCECGDLPF